MSIENIIFEDSDNAQTIAIKTCLLYAGTTELTNQLKKLGVTHTKVQKGGIVKYVLRGKSIGRVEVRL